MRQSTLMVELEGSQQDISHNKNVKKVLNTHLVFLKSALNALIAKSMTNIILLYIHTHIGTLE